MKRLNEIWKGIRVLQQEGPDDVQLTGICQDSRAVGKGSLFVAVKGTRVDGHRFIQQAVEDGAAAVVCEEWPEKTPSGITLVRVASSAAALGQLAAGWYGHPSEKMKLVGVTGTNGKTTIASLLYEWFSRAGFVSGLVSTIQYRVAGESLPASHTTPDALSLNALLARMVDARVEYAFMEVSSHAVVQERISGISFAGGIFTNITRDHLDYHKDFDDYLRAKKRFFDGLPAGAFALVNADEVHGRVMAQNTRARVKTYGIKNMADYRARVVEAGLEGMMLRFGDTEMWTPFIGDFNASNLLAVYAALCELGQPSADVIRILSSLKPVRGRFETIRGAGGTLAVVDYAHTPDALENVLKTLSRVRDEQHRIITVVGAGGDRDRGKRPLMARIAAEYSDRLILTSDNPRSEDPEAILDEMVNGLEGKALDRMLRITDRKEAIRTALVMAGPRDIVLVAGKGHETYQEIKGVRHPFDDREVIREYMK